MISGFSAAAIAAAAPVAEVSRHPDLVAALISAAESLGDAETAALWRERQAAGELVGLVVAVVGRDDP